MVLLADERLSPYMQSLAGLTGGLPYGNDAVVQPVPSPAPSPDTDSYWSGGFKILPSPDAQYAPGYGPDMVAKPIPSPTPAPTTTKPIQQFNQLLYGSTTIPNDLKIQISNLAKTAYQGEYSAKEIQALHQAIFGSALPQDLKLQLAKLIDYQKAAPKPTTPTGGGTGTGSGTGTGGHDGGGTGGAGTYSISGDIGAFPGSIAGMSLGWAEKILSGNFSDVPLYDELTDPKYSDPTQNPYIQAMVGSLQGEMQEDWLGQQAALAEAAEAQGRYGSGLYQALSTRATEETQEALAQAISSMYMGAYENERQRRAGLFGQFLGTQSQAAQLPIQVGQLGVQQAQLGLENKALGIQAGQLSLARSQFAFQKKMGLLGAQQDALSDYLAILLGIGGLGGSQTTQGSGQYVPSGISPTTAAILGGLGGYTQGQQLVNYWGGAGGGSGAGGIQ